MAGHLNLDTSRSQDWLVKWTSVRLTSRLTDIEIAKALHVRAETVRAWGAGQVPQKEMMAKIEKLFDLEENSLVNDFYRNQQSKAADAKNTNGLKPKDTRSFEEVIESEEAISIGTADTRGSVDFPIVVGSLHPAPKVQPRSIGKVHIRARGKYSRSLELSGKDGVVASMDRSRSGLSFNFPALQIASQVVIEDRSNGTTLGQSSQLVLQASTGFILPATVRFRREVWNVTIPEIGPTAHRTIGTIHEYRDNRTLRQSSIEIRFNPMANELERAMVMGAALALQDTNFTLDAPDNGLPPVALFLTTG